MFSSINYLNTSYVNVNPFFNLGFWSGYCHLNTSYVNVNLMLVKGKNAIDKHLNTSYVNVNRNCEQDRLSELLGFKYILC